MIAGNIMIPIMTTTSTGTALMLPAMVATTGWMVYGERFSRSLPQSLPGQDHARESPKRSLFSIAFKPLS